MNMPRPLRLNPFDPVALRDGSTPMSWPRAAAAYLRGLCATLAARPY